MRKDINAILRSKPVSCTYGAPMGKPNRFNGKICRNGLSSESHEPLYVQRIRFVDGDYAPDGTYWGGGSRLYCAFNSDSEIYIRADNRSEAIQLLKEDYPNAKLHRP